MIVDDLFIVEIGNIGRIYWMVQATKEVADDEKQEIRQKSIADTLNATLMNAMFNPSGANQSMETSIQRGWTEANKQINTLETQSSIRSEIFMIGDPSTINRIEEIETSFGFLQWTNPYLIEEIKKLR